MPCAHWSDRGEFLSTPALWMRAHGPVCLGAGRGGCFVACAPCPILSIHKTMCLRQVGGPQKAGLISRGSSWASVPWRAGEALPARKPLRRCPHYITDIPATRPASLRRGASPNAKQDPAPSGRQRARGATLPSGGRTERGQRQIPDPQTGAVPGSGRRGATRGRGRVLRAGRQRARG